MERKQFLTAAMGAAAVLAGTALAADAAPIAGPISTPLPPQPMPTPSPGHHNWQRNQQRSDRNISRVRRHLEHVIDELNHDQYDYGGHREKALDLLSRAREELLAAEQYDAQHPNGQPTARPF